MAGLFDRFNEFMTPERSIQFQGAGQALSQLGAGQSVDISNSMQALNQRRQAAEQKRNIAELSQRFTPDQQAVLAGMPPELAIQVISQDAFRAPAAPVAGINVGGNLINPVTGEVMYQAPVVPGSDTPTDIRSLQMQAELAGLVPGSPEYQEFMLAGGGSPSAFRALDEQARAAGFVPGTEEYQEFMATRGAGLQSYARATGENTADIETGGEAAFAVAEGTGMGKTAAELSAELAEMERNMPSLVTVVDELKGLAETATYTGVGRAADATSRAMGLDVGQGAIDRADFIAKIDNQVLPLLRQTFGAAFTAAEGQSLRATMGDPNMSPAEKIAVLNSFIEQKQRDLLSRGGTIPGSGENTATMSDDELLQLYGGGN